MMQVESILGAHVSQRRIQKEKILICGWRRDIRDVLKMLDAALAPGSEIHLISPVPLNRRTEQLLDEGLDVTKLMNAKLIHHAGNASSRRRLDELPMEHFTSVMIFADQPTSRTPCMPIRTLWRRFSLSVIFEPSGREEVRAPSWGKARLDKLRWTA